MLEVVFLAIISALALLRIGVKKRSRPFCEGGFLYCKVLLLEL